MTRNWLSIALSAITLCLIAVASLALTQQGNVWTMDMDSAGHKGTQTTTITVTYLDAAGKKQSKPITATTDIPANTTAAQKKALVKAKIDAALADAANQVGGTPLASTGGLGDTIQFQPAADPAGTPPPFTGAKITKITTSDKATGEKDKVTEPAQIATSLGTIEAIGDITGLTEEGASSVFSVITSAGVISIPLTPGMTRLALLDDVATALSNQGAVSVWVDADKVILFVTLGGEVDGLGAGTSDAGILANASLQIR